MDRLLDLSQNSIQYGNSMCPSMIRKLKVIAYFRKVFPLSQGKQANSTRPKNQTSTQQVIPNTILSH
jgi:hypothetical protein